MNILQNINELQNIPHTFEDRSRFMPEKKFIDFYTSVPGTLTNVSLNYLYSFLSLSILFQRNQLQSRSETSRHRDSSLSILVMSPFGIEQWRLPDLVCLYGTKGGSPHQSPHTQFQWSFELQDGDRTLVHSVFRCSLALRTIG